MKKKPDQLIRRILMSLTGVFLCGVGVGMFKFASFGVDPFQSLMAGLNLVIPLSFGSLYLIANLLLLLFSLISDRSKIGLATVINLTLLGYVADGTRMTLRILLPWNFPLRVLMLVLGLLTLAISCSLYFTADLGVSTYDALALTFHQWQPRLSFPLLRVLTDFVCVLLGLGLFLLSRRPLSEIGQVAGAGTLITACCLGPMIEFCNTHISGKLLKRF